MHLIEDNRDKKDEDNGEEVEETSDTEALKLGGKDPLKKYEEVEEDDNGGD
jgi:hypothetical protein